jgi:biopolymer transport protein ExbD
MASIQQGRRGGAIVGINMTPMVDIVLVLLVIMMVSATYIVSKNLKVDLPKASQSDDAVPAIVKVTITRDHQHFVDDAPIATSALAARLHDAHAKNPEVSVVVSADAKSEHGDVVHVIDLAKAEGIGKLAIQVELTK